MLSLLTSIFFPLCIQACSFGAKQTDGIEPQPTTSRPHDAESRNEVIVLGTIHERHRTSEVYTVTRLKEIVQSIKPDYILCEIPPDRLERALQQFREGGSVTDTHFRSYPEYTDAVFPLSGQMKFEIIPCSGWTRELTKAREDKLRLWRTTRPEESNEVQVAIDRAETLIQTEGMSDDPLKIHSDRYDAIVKEGVQPYSRLFNKDLGSGGWDNINNAHYAMISKALNQHRGEGKRFLIMFGSWHKYCFME